MIASLDYLPETKQEELAEICELIVQELSPAMILLFGSYARNTWAEEITQEEGINLEFKSDYDILIITRNELNKTANDRWTRIRKKLNARKFSTAVSVIQHSVGYINKELRAGGYFFTDVIRDSKVLYDTGTVTLEQPGNVDPEEAKQRAKEEFERWFESGGEFLEGYQFYFNNATYNKAAFLLHQATEAFYTAILLVFTGYKGKIHDIEELGKQVANLHPEFVTVFPMDSPDHIECFHRLKKAYIDSRYKKNYSISKEDLEYLSSRVEILRDLVGMVCGERLG